MDLLFVKESYQNKYFPGQCNIGIDEITKRLRIGYAGLSIMIVFIIVFEIFQLPISYKFFLFIPSAYALSGFLQAQQKFCFLYGLMGLFSTTGKRQKIVQDDELGKDRMKALELILQVFLGSLLITLLYYYLE